MVIFLLRSLSIPFRLSSLNPNVNGVAVLVSEEEVAIFRLTFRANVGINADNNYLMKPFSILSETSN